MTILLHPDRYNPTSSLVKLGVVVHDSESGDGSSATLVHFLQMPGDRPSDGGGFYGAGYHAVTDGWGGYITVADATCGPFAAPPVNATWWHVCIPGYAHQTRAEWLDTLSMAHIRGVANFIHDKWIEDGKTWTPGFTFADELLRGAKGYTGHAQVSLAWHKSTHTDPGPNFPWDVLQEEVLALTRPQPIPEPPNGAIDVQVSVLRITDSIPPADFLGLATPGGAFWEVDWVDGSDPAQVKMRDTQIQYGHAPVHEFASHVLSGLSLTSKKVPSGTSAYGTPWTKEMFGKAAFVE